MSFYFDIFLITTLFQFLLPMGSTSAKNKETKLAEDFFNNFMLLTNVQNIEKISKSLDFIKLLYRVEIYKREAKNKELYSKLQIFLGTYNTFYFESLDFETVKNIIYIIRKFMIENINLILNDVDIIDILSLDFIKILFDKKLKEKIMLKIQFTNISLFLRSTDHLFPDSEILNISNYINNTYPGNISF